MFFNQGEACVAGSRLFVPRALKDDILSELAARASGIVQGASLDPATQMGPLVSQVQLERVMGFIERGVQSGAKVVTGGGRNQELSDGYFVQPTIFTAQDDTEIAREEIFGPVLTVLEYDDLDDLVNRANKSVYGLGAGIWTRDVKTGIRLAHRLHAGTVWINGWGMLEASLPWGGYKQSGIGREMSSYALEHYTEVKTVWVNLL
jgi:acyl-CoA reductase-like NAD-dependent aldehyde dehydrogenase